MSAFFNLYLLFIISLLLSPFHTNLILLFSNAAPHLFYPFIFSSIPVSQPPPSLTLLTPLFPLVASQTNGAHYRLAKNSRAAKSIHFFSFFLSLVLPFLMLLFFLFSVPPSGGKWVTGRRLVSSFISWQPMCSSLCYQGWAAEAVGLRAWDSAPGCLSVKVLSIWLWSLGHRLKTNEWRVVGTMDITFWSDQWSWICGQSWQQTLCSDVLLWHENEGDTLE